MLELGGKSPCIVDKDADIKVAAKRIAWGKSLNAGQTCIAPDYLMIHEEIKDEFIKELEISFKELLGENPHKTRHFVRIVSDKAFERLEGYLKDGQIAFGGLNALNECEKTVLRRMRNAGLAEFCWDWSSAMIKDPLNKASMFMSQNVRDFPQAFEPDGGDCGPGPRIEIVSVPSSVGQAKHLPEILRNVADSAAARPGA